MVLQAKKRSQCLQREPNDNVALGISVSCMWYWHDLSPLNPVKVGWGKVVKHSLGKKGGAMFSLKLLFVGFFNSHVLYLQGLFCNQEFHQEKSRTGILGTLSCLVRDLPSHPALWLDLAQRSPWDWQATSWCPLASSRKLLPIAKSQFWVSSTLLG